MIQPRGKDELAVENLARLSSLGSRRSEFHINYHFPTWKEKPSWTLTVFLIVRPTASLTLKDTVRSSPDTPGTMVQIFVGLIYGHRYKKP